jgi:hypothetical protein
VPREAAVAAPRQITCQCGVMVTLVTFTGDHTVMIPVDHDRNPAGGLVIVGSEAGYTVRPVACDEEPEARLLRRAHWDTCPHVARWRDAMRAAGVVGHDPAYDPMRAGPCARCLQRHP